MKAKEIAMVIALSILGAFFVGLLFDAIYESPEYEDFCKFDYPRTPELVKEPCPILPTNPEVERCYQEKGTPEFNYDEKGCQTTFKSCNYCNRDYNNATSKYNRNLFFIIAPIGIVAILIGLYLTLEVVGTGLMFAGILLTAYATMRYFSDMSKILRVIVIFIEFVLLIIISIKKLKK